MRASCLLLLVNSRPLVVWSSRFGGLSYWYDMCMFFTYLFTMIPFLWAKWWNHSRNSQNFFVNWFMIFQNRRFMSLNHNLVSLHYTSHTTKITGRICGAFVGEDTEDEIQLGREADEKDGNRSQEGWGMEGGSTATALPTAKESIWAFTEDEESAQLSIPCQLNLWLLPLQQPALVQTKQWPCLLSIDQKSNAAKGSKNDWAHCEPVISLLFSSQRIIILVFPIWLCWWKRLVDFGMLIELVVKVKLQWKKRLPQ